MKQYASQIQHHMKYFFKCRSLAAVSIFVYILVYLGEIYFIGRGMGGYELLYLLSRFSFYFSAILCTVSWVYLERPRMQQVDEVLQTIDKRRFSYQFYGFVVQAICSALFFAFVLAVLIICSVRNDSTSYFLIHMLYPFLCNIVFPHFIILGAVFVLSKGSSYIKALCIYIVFLVLLSPFAENIVWRQKPVVPIDQIVNIIRWPFTLFYQNGEWSADIQYGLQTEDVRVAVQGFWIGFIVCANYLINQGKRRKRVICGASMVLAIFLLVYSCLPASLYRLNFKWDGSLYDLSVYQVFQGENEMDKALLKNPGYRVADYNLNLKFGRQMKVQGVLKVESDRPRTEFLFTLYRDFDLNQWNVEDLQCKCRREGDSIIVSFAKPVESFETTISYSGFHKKFYSNSQAAMLPGYFPWYPMAGERQIFLENTKIMSTYGYNPYNRIEKAHVRLQTDGKFRTITNLKSTGENEYEGDADSITLFGGQMEEADHFLFENYLPLDTGDSKDIGTYLSELTKKFDDTLTVLEEEYGFDTTELRDKKIICPSKDIGRNFFNNKIFVFEDYLIAAQGMVDSGDVLQYYIFEQNKQTPLISLFCTNGIWALQGLSGLENMEGALEAGAQESEAQGVIENDRQAENRKLLENIRKSCERVGEERFLKALVQYAVTDNGINSDEAFFQQWGNSDDKE